MLQVLSRAGKWIRLRPPEGCIIVNVGDYMQRITNDVLPSTTHRVTTPTGEQAQLARTSTPIAVYLKEHETLSVLPGLGEPKYEDVEVLDFHTSVMGKYYGKKYREENGED